MATAICEIEAAPAAARRSPSCLYCGSNEFVPLFSDLRDRLGHAPGTWSMLRCDECGSASLRPFPANEELASFYPPVYTFSPDLARGAFQRLLGKLEYRLFFCPVYRAQVQIVERHLRRHGEQPGKLLDVGCGRGLRLVEFRRRGFDVQGMDFDESAATYLREQLRIPAMCTTIDRLHEAFGPESLQVVTAFAVLEHLTDVVSAIRACMDLLKPGGWFVAQMPFIDSVQASLLGRRWEPVVEAPRHVTLPTVAGTLRAFERADVNPADVHFVPDSALLNASLIPLSLFSRGAATHVFGKRSLVCHAARLAAAALVPVLWPWGVVENRVFRRPAQWIVLARKR